MVYVAGPLSKGNVAHNVRKAIEIAEKLWEIGYVPFIPHLTHFWSCISPHPDEEYIDKNGKLAFWLEYDFEVLKRCQALFRIRGESVGADMEVELANKSKIPVFYDLLYAQLAVEDFNANQ